MIEPREPIGDEVQEGRHFHWDPWKMMGPWGPLSARRPFGNDRPTGMRGPWGHFEVTTASVCSPCPAAHPRVLTLTCAPML